VPQHHALDQLGVRSDGVRVVRRGAGHADHLGARHVAQRRRADHGVEGDARVGGHHVLGVDGGEQLRERPVAGFGVRPDQPRQSVGGRGALLRHDPVELGGGGGERHEAPEHRAERLERFGRRGDRGEVVVELLEAPVDRRPPQVVLAAEVVVHERLGDAGALGDGPGGGAVEAVVGELHERGVDDAPTGPVGAGLAADGRPSGRASPVRDG